MKSRYDEMLQIQPVIFVWILAENLCNSVDTYNLYSLLFNNTFHYRGYNTSYVPPALTYKKKLHLA
jgi:hypothetical protein